MQKPPARLRTKASWLINKTSLHAHRLVVEGMVAMDARTYHFAILAALEEGGPASQAAISQLCGIDRSDIVAMVNELVEQGLVVRAPDPDDRRRNIITMTPAGSGERPTRRQPPRIRPPNGRRAPKARWASRLCVLR